MKISQTTSELQALQGAKKQSQALKKPAHVVVEQDKQQQNKKQTRFDVDQKSLALVQQSYEQNQQPHSQSHAQKADYDQPSAQNQTAVSVYQSVSNLNQRENIQQLFGVDLLA